ncbi:MAG: hypothetical protein AAGK71_10740 [Pseudomonadota bacterium]
MRALILASALAIPAATQAEPCDPERMNCSPLVACIEETGEYFRGASFGYDAGPFRADSVSGAACTGTWRRTFLGIGIAEFTCSDGRMGSSVFNWFEPESGTAVGHGTFVDGTVARFWAGTNLERYFEEIDPLERERMACNPTDMLLS